MSRPWMPLYIADYLADTAHLNAAEHGAYLLLIMHYWRTGGLPEDETKLARIARMTSRQWSHSRDLLRSFFGDHWCHKRIDMEIAQAIEKTERRSANAHAMHERRRANALHQQTQSQPQSESKKVREEPALRAAPPRKRRASLKVPLSPDWEPQKVVSPDKLPELVRFKNSARAHDRRYADWDAAWENWQTSPLQGVSNGRLEGNPVSNPKSVSALAKALERRLVGEADSHVVLSLPQGRLSRPGGVSGAAGGNPGTLPAGSGGVRDGPDDGYSAPTDFPAFNRGGR
jgi:uncharacterized protein YdaU (DUF1376 family)